MIFICVNFVFPYKSPHTGTHQFKVVCVEWARCCPALLAGNPRRSHAARSSYPPAPCTATGAFPAPWRGRFPRCSPAGSAEFLPCCLSVPKPQRWGPTCGAVRAPPPSPVLAAGARTLAVRYPPCIPPFSGLYVAFRSSDNLLPNVFHICSASLIQIPATTRPAQSGALGGRKLTPPPACGHTHT